MAAADEDSNAPEKESKSLPKTNDSEDAATVAKTEGKRDIVSYLIRWLHANIIMGTHAITDS